MSGVDPMAFRRALGKFPTGVCIVTTRVEGEAVGMTMSSFNSLSLDPPLVLFSIDRRALSLPLWEQAEGYAVHVLSENQQDLSNRFARPAANKWEGVLFRDGMFGAPILPGVAAIFECSAYARHDGGDHRLFIGEVRKFSADPDRRPLVFAQGRYAALHRSDTTASLWPLDIHY
jgi:flavin reductase (DIM6/NTAB) family NADH-FMN oxidoreductase RutF